MNLLIIKHAYKLKAEFLFLVTWGQKPRKNKKQRKKNYSVAVTIKFQHFETWQGYPYHLGLPHFSYIKKTYQQLNILILSFEIFLYLNFSNLTGLFSQQN